jgi:hypothetical protein
VVAQRKQFAFPISAHKLLKRAKVRKKRVVDTSKVLRILEELEEQKLFKHIIESK